MNSNSLTYFKKNLVFLFFFICFLHYNILAIPSSDIVYAGGLKIPSPQNMVNATDYSEKFRILFKAAPKNCFALYVLDNEINDTSQNLIPSANRMAYANLSSVSNSKEEAEDLFIKDMVDLKLNIKDILLHQEEIDSLIRSGEKNVESQIPNTSVDVKYSRFVDLDLSKAWRGSFTIIGDAQVEIDGQPKSVSVASAHGWILIKRTTLHLIYNVNLKDANSLTEAKNGLHRWMDSIKAINAK